MTASLRFVLRGLFERGQRARSTLIVVALGLGLASFGALLGAFAILEREVARGYAGTHPAAATLWTDVVDEELLASVAAVEGVAVVDARRVLQGRLKTGPLQWRTLQLVVPRSFEQLALSRFAPGEGSWPPALGEVLLERDARSVAKARIGDTVIVQIGAENAVDHRLRIGGTVHDPGQAQARMENVVYGYVTRETMEALPVAAAADRLLLAPVEGAPIAAVVARVQALLSERGRPLRRTEISKGHPHAELMQLLMRIQAGFGVALLIVATLFAVLLFSAGMARQVRQVGVLRAIGARRAQIAGLFLAQALLLGLVACACAWPIALVAGRFFAGYLSIFLNFDLLDRSVPAWVLLLQLGAGIALPLLAAAWPVWSGSAVPLREALAEHGGGRAAFGRSAFERWIARGSGGGALRPLLYSLRNALRRRGRSAIVLATLALGGVGCAFALDLRASMIATLDRLFVARRYDLSLVLGSMQPLANIERAAAATPGIAAVEGWVTTQATLPTDEASADDGVAVKESSAKRVGFPGMHGSHASAASAGESFTMLAPPPGTQLFAPEIVSGRFLAREDVDALVLNEALAARCGSPSVGDTLRLQMGPQRKDWSIVGIVREPFSPPMGYVPRAFFERAGHAGMINTVRLDLVDAEEGASNALLAALEANLAQEQVRVLSRQRTGDARFSFDQHFVMIYDALLAIAGLVLLFGGACLASSLALALRERRRELGILRAIGASPRLLARLVVAEACGLAALAWIFAVLLAWPLSELVCGAFVNALFRTQLAYTAEPLSPVLLLVVSLVIAVGAGALPAWRARRMSVREALAGE
ncbi:MAG: FtsX-like permease family protein [Planctomycetes bacterium]|nr:FtsX-like permease family protein [Planctomycetota bacterium]